jgi:hypothetical protein
MFHLDPLADFSVYSSQLGFWAAVSVAHQADKQPNGTFLI